MSQKAELAPWPLHISPPLAKSFIWPRASRQSCSHLLLLATLQVPPFLNGLAQVHCVHGHLHLANDVMLGEAIEVVDGHHQRLPAQFLVGNLHKEGHQPG